MEYRNKVRRRKSDCKKIFRRDEGEIEKGKEKMELKKGEGRIFEGQKSKKGRRRRNRV